MLSDTVLLYFFSASFQGLAALLGLLGVFAIFRLQQLGSAIDGVRNLLYGDRGKSIWPSEIEKFERLSHHEKKIYIDKLDPKIYESTLLPLMRSWFEAERQIINLRNKMWKPVGYLGSCLSFKYLGSSVLFSSCSAAGGCMDCCWSLLAHNDGVRTLESHRYKNPCSGHNQMKS